MATLTLTKQLERAGWKLLPIPVFYAARAFWNDGNGRGNAACISFAFPHDWAVIPPEDHPERARVVEGRNRAIRIAAVLAGLRQPPAANAEARS